MSYELPEESSRPPLSGIKPPSDKRPESATAGTREAFDDATRTQPPSPVRGEAVRDQDAKSSSQDPQTKDKAKAPPKPVSEAKMKKQSRLPALDDDADIGVQMEQVTTRDGKPDLSFGGTLIASAAPASAPKGKWQEYRVYETSAGKHVFSKVTRTVFADEQDANAAEVFDPSPSSVPSQLLRTARDLTRSHPLTWTDAAASFFGYDPLAKALYRKLSGKFEEHIN
jgi:hypothetical protein